MKFKRILLKLSGESLMGDQRYGIDAKRVNEYVSEIKTINKLGVEVAIVIGGGNIFRGVKGLTQGVNRVDGDFMGMMATVINGMALQSAFEKQGIKTALFSGIAINPLCERMNHRKAIDALKEKKIVILVGGTGNPYFTTDTAAALRALEIQADAILKGTRVDGVYSADPEKNKKATKYSEITFDEVYKRNLNVMDLTAFTLCKENKMPIIVFNMNVKGNLKKIVSGQKVGTLVKS